MAGRVHADEAGSLLPLRLVGHLNTAEFRTRRIVLVVEFDREDVVVARHRPIRPERRGLAIMHGIVAAQLREQRPPGVVLIEVGIADVDRRQPALLPPGPSLPSPRSVAAFRAISIPTIGADAVASKAGRDWPAANLQPCHASMRGLSTGVRADSFGTNHRIGRNDHSGFRRHHHRRGHVGPVPALPAARTGPARAGVRGRDRCRRHLVLEPLSRRALQFRKLFLRLLVLEGIAAGMGLVRAFRRPAGNAALSQLRRRQVRPAPRHPVSQPGHGGRLRRGHAKLDHYAGGRQPASARAS